MQGGQRTGKAEEAGVVQAKEKKAEDRHAKSLHRLKRPLQREGESSILGR